ncbi:zinc transporter ZntB [Providencia alcalifaciens]|uniref:zinc transporter ZntB n=1 Tax=Providencia alcalifaciens TaxID=126385 RepID=UPI001CC66EEC|nr:zinc transporter ZntB [Providencia alcalifaciens]CAG9414756.1 Zinc transport protein ZntB [Providencia alcalifaciens]CAG9418823.1 Zinc transport protein ZntB [Providencia alcalifaciens]CAG9419814.1 Zinc transport protein ZntB [Providencia alcalifaciens]CAG9419981.1 Zinc transport protein ZntB [Providencia alcalifaciens]CAG9422191.1 Zinc transport protein ZntB [Providencia alcalifaciens]
MASTYGSQFQHSSPVHAFQLDGNGGVLPIDLNANATQQSPFWLHYDYKNKETASWIQQTDLFNDQVKSSLTGKMNRMRMVRIGDGVLLTLQTLNNTTGQRPEQLVAFRIFMNSRLIVSCRHRRVHSLDSVIDDLKEGVGAQSTGEWLADVTDAMTDEISDFTDSLHERLIEMEDVILHGEIPERGELALLRKQIIVVRRYMAPQRDMFSRLTAEKLLWLDEDDRRRLQEISDRLGRCIEDLDGFIARTAIMSDEITNMMTEMMNRRIYTMSLMAMIFLPTTFLTGLFGVNLGGIPGNEFKFAFSTFCLLLAGLIATVFWWLKRSRWL